MSRSSFARNLVPLVAVVLLFSVPILGLLRPILSQLVPLVYIVSILGLGTLCARNLMDYHHRLKMKEMERQAELARLDAERYRAAESLIASDDPLERKLLEIKRKHMITGTASPAGDEPRPRDEASPQARTDDSRPRSDASQDQDEKPQTDGRMEEQLPAAASADEKARSDD